MRTEFCNYVHSYSHSALQCQFDLWSNHLCRIITFMVSQKSQKSSKECVNGSYNPANPMCPNVSTVCSNHRSVNRVCPFVLILGGVSRPLSLSKSSSPELSFDSYNWLLIHSPSLLCVLQLLQKYYFTQHSRTSFRQHTYCECIALRPVNLAFLCNCTIL